MKMKIAKILFAAAMIGFGVSRSNAQVVVSVRPVRPVAVVAVNARPPAPSPRAVWVDEEWAPGPRGVYAWRGGHWALPPRPGVSFVRGHWRGTPRGFIWIPGHWR